MRKQPNVLFLFTDQQRSDTIHALGNERICTPALDALAEEAAVFENCVTPAPVCVPARFSMYSGLYPAHSGCCNNNYSSAYEGDGFYSLFTREGYQTCCVGKMHHTKDLYGPMGFEKRFMQEEMSDPLDDYTRFIREGAYKNVFDYNGQRSEMYYIPQISQLPAEAHPTQWVGDRSVEFLSSCDPERPFFLMSSFIHPHPPFAPPAPWNKMYRTVSEEPYMPDEPKEFAAFLSDRFTLEKIGVSRQDLSLLKNFYYACISFVDYQISRIVDVLKARGMFDDTIIVFSSDHGELLGDFGTMGKRSMLDGALKIPLMIRRPGFEGERRSDVCSLVDIAPTLLSCAGIEYDGASYDGVNLFSDARHEEVFSQFSTGDKGAYTVASGRDKLVYHAFENRWYYFDESPEDKNKYDESNPRVRALRRKLEQYMSEDQCADGGGSADFFSGKNKFPYGPKRGDHINRRDEELARMPKGYNIDI